MFKLVVKDRLFYDHYEYCIMFHLQDVDCLRTLDHAQIDRIIERKFIWRGALRGTDQSMIPGNSAPTPARMLPDVDNLHTLADLLITSANFKLVVCASTGYVYTNDLTLIDTVSKSPGVCDTEHRRAVVCRPRNTIQLRDPKYQWRSYFRTSKLTAEQKTQLVNFLANQPEIRISPALTRWIDLNLNRTLTHDYFFVDYNDSAWLTMLSLVIPSLIRKTLEIIPAK